MRLTFVAPLAVLATVACAKQPEGFDDLKIDVVLALEKDKCVVRFAESRFKDPAVAVAYTAHAVIWQVTKNDCGERKREKPDGKALGLKYLRRKGSTEPAPWLGRCQHLNLVPGRFRTPPAFRCDIPSAQSGGWDGSDEVQIYEYEIDGDAVEPLDPGIGVKKNG
jgi:hypothetical protein